MNILKKNIIHICLVVFCLALPLSKGIASVAMVVLLLLSFIRILQTPTLFFFALKNNKTALTVSSLWMVYAWSSFYSTDFNNASLLLYRQISLLVIPFIAIVNYELIRKRFAEYLTYLIAATICNGLVCLLFFCLPDAVASDWATTVSFLKPYPSNQNQLAFGLYSPFIDRIQLSNLVAISTLSTLWLILINERKKPFVICTFILLFINLLLGGRGAQIGLLIGLLVWVIGLYFRYVHSFLKQKIGRWLALSVLGVALIVSGILTPYFAYQTIPSVFSRYHQLFWELEQFSQDKHLDYDYHNFSSIRRLVYFKNGWQFIQQQAIMGVGIGDYHSELKKVYANDNMDIQMNIHQQWLYIWGASGIFGVLLFFSALMWWSKNMYHYAPPLTRIFALSFLVFYLVVMCFDAILRMQIDCMLFAFGISCFIQNA